MRNGGQQRNSESEYKAQIRRRGKVLNQEEKKKKKKPGTFEELWWNSCGQISIEREESAKPKTLLLN